MGHFTFQGFIPGLFFCDQQIKMYKKFIKNETAFGCLVNYNLQKIHNSGMLKNHQKIINT